MNPIVPNCSAVAILAASVFLAAPALAINGEVLITQATASAGNVTPGDAPGFPVTLSRSGSYKLASNLAASPNRSGIQIPASDVTLDLNGFRLLGQGGPFGIFGFSATNVTIRGGTLTGFAQDGIEGPGGHWTVEDMRIIGNGGAGASLGERGAVVRDSTISENGGFGVECTLRCLISGNVIESNGGGIVIQSGTILGNTIIANNGRAIAGAGAVGFGNNTIAANNFTPQVQGAIPLQPNACDPAC